MDYFFISGACSASSLIDLFGKVEAMASIWSNSVIILSWYFSKAPCKNYPGNLAASSSSIFLRPDIPLPSKIFLPLYEIFSENIFKFIMYLFLRT